ncbi:cation:proton antiporter [Candidatus Woesearchaeota archaeon]|nr:cation:proton antiporter [Candidatus Woesearchaeota archaeon]
MALNIFFELTIIIAVALVMAVLMKVLRQPLIIGYILTGVIVSPHFLNILQSEDVIQTFAHLGVTLLLFMVGLNLNPKSIKEIGKISLVTGVGQVIFTFIIGYVIASFLNFSHLTSLYLAIAISFSSTILIMTLLSDKGDLEALYGRISIGFLIVQDLIAILILMVVSTLPQGVDISTLALGALVKGVIVLFLLALTALYFLPIFTRFIAKSQELLLLFSLSWCFAIAAVFSHLKFSMEAGALLAGIALSLSPYRYEISSKLKPLRNFFIIIFFVILGSNVVFTDATKFLVPAFALSLFVLVGNPLIVISLMGLLGFTKRSSFLAGLTVAQISEFSLILVALGVALGHLPLEILSLLTVVALITMAASTYLILYSDKIYPFFSPYLSFFERKGKKIDEHKYQQGHDHDILLFGHNRVGHDILESFQKIRRKVLIIDYNPEIIINLAKEGYECKYGDADDVEMLGELNFDKTKMVISTIPTMETNLLVINKIKEINTKAIIVVISHQIDDALKLYEAGATYVLLPHFLGGNYVSKMVKEYGLNIDKYLKERISHVKYLKGRKKVEQERNH